MMGSLSASEDAMPERPDREEEAILAHVRDHYRGVYGNARTCRLSLLKGKDLAAALGYPLSRLSWIPDDHWDGFLPCGNPLPLLQPAPGDTILNLGCGASIDSFALLSTPRGPTLRIVNMDVVPDLLRRTRSLYQRCFPHRAPGVLPSSDLHQSGSLLWICGSGEQPPFPEEAFDWILLNGVFNLFPDKNRALTTFRRILRPGGRVVGADLCCRTPVPDYFREEMDAWAWCMSGARTREDLLHLFADTGWEEPTVRSEGEEEELFHGVLFSCRKPDVSKA